MTKKDYIRAAEIIRKEHPEPDGSVVLPGAVLRAMKRQKDEVVDCFVVFFKTDNPRFDEERFREACRK